MGPIHRRRPLHTCAASMSAIIHAACRKTQELNGPIGTLTKRVTRFMSAAFPLMNAMQHLCLAILSFTDDRILTLERIVETIFPPSTHLFDKIDKLVYTAEVIPEKLDKAFYTFHNTMHHVPFLDWVVMHLIWCLNFLISSLTHWGSKNSLREKDIMIDTNCKNSSTIIEAADKANCVREEETASISCPSEEKLVEVEKAENHVEPPTISESNYKEELLPVADSLKAEMKPIDNAEGTVESSCSDLISAPRGNYFEHENKSVRHVELPSIAEDINKEELLPVLASFQDESKLICHVEFSSTAEHKNKEELLSLLDSLEDGTDAVNNVECPSICQSEDLISSPAGDAFQDESKSVGCVESTSRAEYENKEELLPASDLLEDKATTNKNADSSTTPQSEYMNPSAMGGSLEGESKSVCIKLQLDIVESSDKEMLGKGTKENTEMKANIALEDSAQITATEEKNGLDKEETIKKNKKKEDNQRDLILDLFEARWQT